MNRPASGPDSEALALVDELVRLSREILAGSVNPQLPELAQLILRRGKLVDEIQALPAETLSDDTRQQLSEKLTVCHKLDPCIEQNLAAYQNGLGEQLKGYREGMTLLERYRLGPDPGTGTRAQDA